MKSCGATFQYDYVTCPQCFGKLKWRNDKPKSLIREGDDRPAIRPLELPQSSDGLAEAITKAFRDNKNNGGNNMSAINAIKPTIPNDVADAIESFRKDGNGNANMLRLVIDPPIAHTSRRCALIQTIPFDTLLAALVNGYEREQTAEQIAEAAVKAVHAELKRVYLKKRQDARLARGEGWMGDDWRLTAYADGIKFALDTLGVKITEVNGR
jgi:hypothetical protein